MQYRTVQVVLQWQAVQVGLCPNIKNMEHTQGSSTLVICFKDNILILSFLLIFFLLKQRGVLNPSD